MNSRSGLPAAALIALLAVSSSVAFSGRAASASAPTGPAGSFDPAPQTAVEAQRLRKLFERAGPLQPETPYTLPEDTTAAHELNAMRLELQTLRAQLTRAGLPIAETDRLSVLGPPESETPRLLQRIADRLEEPAMVVAPPMLSAATGLPLAVSTLIVAILFAILKRDMNGLKKVDVKAAVTAAAEATTTKWDDRLLAIFGRFLPSGPDDPPPTP